MVLAVFKENSEAFDNHIFYKQHLIVIYLYIVENYVAGYRAARQLIIQCIYLAIESFIHTLWLMVST